jgi:carboxyl-terminal processing protease
MYITKKILSFFLLTWLFCAPLALCEAKTLSSLTNQRVKEKLAEIMEQHATHKFLTKELLRRSLLNFLEELDPYKTYFIEKDVTLWLEPSDEFLLKLSNCCDKADYSVFSQILDKMQQAILRRRELESQIDLANLSEQAADEKELKLLASEFKDLSWTKSPEELKERLTKIQLLQQQAVGKLPENLRERGLKRIAKQKEKFESELLSLNTQVQRDILLTRVMKAITHALDSQTDYYTPEEAEQFIIHVQQKLSGIGAQLRDDLNGLTIVKIVEGGPAAVDGQLKAKDRIIAVNNEPIVGMDIVDAVALIRGPEGTPTTLTVIREKKEGDDVVEEKLDITLRRGEVIFKDARYKVSSEPYGDGVIAIFHLYSFYQDSDSSSAADLTKALKELKQTHQIKGVILDLRYNTGGLLNQAINVAGMFITKGIIASIKDSKGNLQHLREMRGVALWDGPLVVLTNRASASASEIVAQSLKDYGRAIIVGDEETFGKGSFQSFSSNATISNKTNPEGEYKVTRGRYYTVSGKSPQLLGVKADIVVPGALSEAEVGEKYSKYPLGSDEIISHFNDDFSDLPFFERYQARLLYRHTQSMPSTLYESYIPLLKQNSTFRVKNNKSYQNFLDLIKKISKEEEVDEVEEAFGELDVQLEEATNIMKDLILLLHNEKIAAPAA